MGKLATNDEYKAYQKELIENELFSQQLPQVSEEALIMASRPANMSDEEWAAKKQKLISAPSIGIEQANGVDLDQKTHNWLQSQEGKEWTREMLNAKLAQDAIVAHDRYWGTDIESNLRLITDPNLKGLKEDTEKMKVNTVTERPIGNQLIDFANSISAINDKIDVAETVVNNALAGLGEDSQLTGMNVDQLFEAYRNNDYPEDKYASFGNYIADIGSPALADAINTLAEARANQETFASLVDETIGEFNPDLTTSGFFGLGLFDTEAVGSTSEMNDLLRSFMVQGITLEEGKKMISEKIANGEITFENAGLNKDEKRGLELWGDDSRAAKNGIEYYAQRYWNEYRNAYNNQIEEVFKNPEKMDNILFTKAVGSSSEFNEVENFFQTQMRDNNVVVREIYNGVEGSPQEVFQEKGLGIIDPNSITVSVSAGEGILKLTADSLNAKGKKTGNKKSIYVKSNTENMSIVRDFHKKNFDNKFGLLLKNQSLDETDIESMTGSLYNFSQYMGSPDLFKAMKASESFDGEVEFEYPYHDPKTNLSFNFKPMGVTKMVVNGKPLYNVYYHGKGPGDNPDDVVDYTSMRVLLGIEKKILDILAKNKIVPGTPEFNDQTAIWRRKLKESANINSVRTNTNI